MAFYSTGQGAAFQISAAYSAIVRSLENAPLRSRSRDEWVVRLRYAYADTLLAAGRHDDAIEWFHRTVGVDGDDGIRRYVHGAERQHPRV